MQHHHWRDFATWGFDHRGWAPTTRTLYVRRARACQRAIDVPLLKANTRHLTGWLSTLPPTPSSRNVSRQALLGFYDWAIWRGSRAHNPMADVPNLAYPQAVPKALTAVQASAVLEACQDPGWLVAVSLMLHTGLRATETRTLAWPAFSDPGWVRQTVKGGQERVLPLHPHTVGSIEAWRGMCPSPTWVVPSPVKDAPIAETTFRGRIAEIGSRAGVVGLHPHGLRHTFATGLLDAGVDVRTLQELLGHRSLATTQKYLRVRPERLRDAVGSLDWAA